MTSVALLNACFTPLGGVSFNHAIGMLVRGVAVVVEADGDRMIGPFPRPRVIQLVRYVAAHWLYRTAGVTKGGVLARDRHTCAYCGDRATTVDHLLPRSRGGDLSWTNCVAACRPCNERKANRTPQQAGMAVRFARPYAPRVADLVAA